MPTQRTTGAKPRDAVVARVRAAVAAALAVHAGPPRAGLVLAVSGGRDSMVLLDATLAVARDRVRLVATYDHGTGAAARRAVRHVCAAARAAGVPVRVGRRAATSADAPATEAAWRAARWAFLRRSARAIVRAAAGDGARVLIATGHTADDQVETVVMRVLRGAGARGVAGMFAPAPGVVRPLLDTPAEDVEAYADARGLAWVDDPANASPRHLRNRVRHGLLPALARARPTVRADLLRLAAEAAAWRREVDAAAAALVRRCAGDALAPTSDAVPLALLADLADYAPGELRVLWPALLAGAGVRADRRGTARLATFTTRCVNRVAEGRAPVGSAPVAGGVRVIVERRPGGESPEWAMVLRRGAGHSSDDAPLAPRQLDAAAGWVAFGRWRFRLVPADSRDAAVIAPTGPAEWRVWRVLLPPDRAYTVRAWRPGDRWRAGPGRPARRVKRFLADRHVPAADRAGWPVVVSDVGGAADAVGGEIVWIPGVRRSDAAPARPGQPGLLLLCDRIRGGHSRGGYSCARCPDAGR